MFFYLVFVSMAIRMPEEREDDSFGRSFSHVGVLYKCQTYFLNFYTKVRQRRKGFDTVLLLPADFMAEVTQGTSEFITTMALLFLVCGWTTTADSESLKSSAARVFSGDSSLESGSAAEGERGEFGRHLGDGRRGGRW